MEIFGLTADRIIEIETWLNPDRNILFQDAIEAACQGERARAAELFAQYVADFPQDAGGWLWLGYCLEDRAKATYCMRRAMELDPLNIEAANMVRRLPQLTAD